MSTFFSLMSKLSAIDIPLAQLASSTVGAVVVENVRAKLQKEFSRFWSFPMDKKQLLEKLSLIRSFLESVGTHQIPNDPNPAWIREIEKRVSEAEAALREIGEDDPNWLNYRRCHAISIEQHREKLDEITKIGTGFYLGSVFPAKPSPVKTTAVDAVSRVFERFDADGDGLISVQELQDALLALGCEIPAEELMDVIDTDGDRLIDLKQFNELLMNTEDNYEDLKRAFDVFDCDYDGADGDGKISFLELKDMLRALGSEISVEELKNMMLKKLGKKRASVDEPSSSSIDPSGRKLKKMRTQLKA